MLNGAPQFMPEHAFVNVLDRVPEKTYRRLMWEETSHLRQYEALKRAHYGSQDHPPTLGRSEFCEQFRKLF